MMATKTYPSIPVVAPKAEDLVCDTCATALISDCGRWVCPTCGLVAPDAVYTDSTYRYYSENLLAGPNHHLQKDYQSVEVMDVFQLSAHPLSKIGYCGQKHFFTNHRGKVLSPTTNALFGRLKRLDKEEQKYGVLNQTFQLQIIYRMVQIAHKLRNRFEVSAVVISTMMRKLYQIRKTYTYISNHVALVAVCFLHAVRTHHLPISVKEIILAMQSWGHRINTKIIVQHSLNYQITSAPIIHGREYIEGMMAVCVLSPFMRTRTTIKTRDHPQDFELFMQQIKLKAYQIEAKLTAMQRGFHPRAIAGGAIYAAIKRMAQLTATLPLVSQEQLGQIINVANYTIRDIYVHRCKPYWVKWIKSDPAF